MHLDEFQLHQPESLPEAISLAREFAGQFDYLAGGTDLLPNYKMHLNPRPHLISLDAIPELHRFSPDQGNLGAMVRLREMEGSAGLASRYPAVAQAAREVATPLVRASGTLGGNLLVETRCFFFNQSYFWRQSLGFCLKADGDRCHVVPQKEKCYATFSGDLAPALMALDARVRLMGPEGTREIPLTDLYPRDGDGIRRTSLRAGEVLEGVTLPPPVQGLRSIYLKLRVRPSYDFPELGVAVALCQDGGRVSHLRVALGGLEMVPRRMDALTDPLVGSQLTGESLRALGEAIRSAVRPVHNTFLAPDYRRKMTAVLVRRAVRSLTEGS